MADEFKDLFGEGESLTYEQFNEKLTASGGKWADLSKGGYVDKAKFDKLSKENAKLKEDAEALRGQEGKPSDYDDLKKENESLKGASKEFQALREEVSAMKAQALESQYMGEVAKANVDEKFARFVMTEVRGLTSEDKDFATALAEYVKQNPQFVKQAQEPEAVVTLGSSFNMEGGKSGTKPGDMGKLGMADYIKARKAQKT